MVAVQEELGGIIAGGELWELNEGMLDNKQNQYEVRR